MVDDIRPLSGDDIPAIIEMTENVWGGNDYVSVALEFWLKDPNSNPSVVERQGEVIGVANVRMMDGKRTGWMEGIRVHPEHRNEGLGRMLTAYMVRQAKSMGARRVRLITAFRNVAAVKLAGDAGLRPVLSMNAFWKGGLSEINWSNNEGDVSRIDAEELTDVIADHQALIPEGVLVYHWDAVDTDATGLESASSETDYWITQRDEEVVAISTGLVFVSPREREWFATVYPSDSSSFLRSFSHHLGLALENECDTLVSIHPPRYTSLYEEEEVLKERPHEIEIGLFEMGLED
jgi:N-acetylglutamate synthase-like GNAT family acetyltransferase